MGHKIIIYCIVYNNVRQKGGNLTLDGGNLIFTTSNAHARLLQTSLHTAPYIIDNFDHFHQDRTYDIWRTNGMKDGDSIYGLIPDFDDQVFMRISLFTLHVVVSSKF